MSKNKNRPGEIITGTVFFAHAKVGWAAVIAAAVATAGNRQNSNRVSLLNSAEFSSAESSYLATPILMNAGADRKSATCRLRQPPQTPHQAILAHHHALPIKSITAGLICVTAYSALECANAQQRIASGRNCRDSTRRVEYASNAGRAMSRHRQGVPGNALIARLARTVYRPTSPAASTAPRGAAAPLPPPR